VVLLILPLRRAKACWKRGDERRQDAARRVGSTVTCVGSTRGEVKGSWSGMAVNTNAQQEVR
jgi:hypothetical protein